MSRRVRLVLDEMHAPAVAAGLRRLGHDAVAAAEQHDLRAASDAELFAWAAVQGRCVVTKDVTDFCRLLDDAREAGQPRPSVAFTTRQDVPTSPERPWAADPRTSRLAARHAAPAGHALAPEVRLTAAPEAQRCASTASGWPSGETRYQACSIAPPSSIRNVERRMPVTVSPDDDSRSPYAP